MGDDAVIGVVVQVGTGLQGNISLMHGLIEAFKKRGVGPCLVAGVGAFALSRAAALGDNDSVFDRKLGRRPLLQLHDDEVGCAVGRASGDKEVDTFGGLGDAEFDADACVVGNSVIPKDRGHLLQGGTPGSELSVGRIAAGLVQIGAGDLVLDAAVFDVLDETGFVGLINDQRASP